MSPARIAATLLLFCFAVSAWAQPVKIEGVRMWPAPDSTRLVFDLSAPVQHSIFVLKNPDRVVIDISDASLVHPIAGLDYGKSLLQDIRSGVRHEHDLRVVLDMKRAVRPKSFLLRPNQQYGNRLVIDLEDAAKTPTPVITSAHRVHGREIVIAIDAGHGGEDPGAHGPHGTKEKNVVLAIARQLEKLVAKQPGMKPFMTRDGDYYVSLRKRIQEARAARADLFVSIHADAFRDRSAHGASVYALSRRGATSEHARWLAAKENSSDLIGGVSLDDKDDLLASVLLDLSQTATIEASTDAASDVLKQLRKVGRVHRNHVERAGFVVLKSPDVPSMLVETAFISNPSEERKLRDPHHQYQIALAIMKGIRVYFKQHAPPGTLLAKRERERRHVIVRGDTLSAIAQQYSVSLDTLRSVNGLHGDTLHVGDTLQIPPSSDS